MKAVLRTSLGGGGAGDKEASVVLPGLRTRTRSRPGRGGGCDGNDGEQTRSHCRPQPRFLLSVVFNRRDSFRSQHAGTDSACGGRSGLRRRLCGRDHGADSAVGHSGSRNQSPAQREEEVQGQPQVTWETKNIQNMYLAWSRAVLIYLSNSDSKY